MNHIPSDTQLLGLIALVDNFINITPELQKLFQEGNIELSGIGSWHSLYEIPNHQLLNNLLNITNLNPEALSYVLSEDPIQNSIDISEQASAEDIDINEFLRTLYAFVKSYESVLYHQQTIHQLIKKIRNGYDTNDNLLQKVIQVDRTAIHCQPIKDRIQQAELSGDEVLFKKISNTLKPRKEPQHSEYAKLTYLIFFLMDNGHLQKMTGSERFSLLLQFKSPYITDESFDRKIYKFMKLYY